MRTKDEKKYVTRATLKGRGWTDSIIRVLLPGPDNEVKNPHCRTGPPMRLYDLARVEHAEASEEFRALAARAAPRRQAALATAEAKRAALLRRVEEKAVELRRVPDAALRALAVAHYNRRADERGEGDYDEASHEADQAFLDRITVNYARHQLTDYEDELGGLYRQVGTAEAYLLLKRRVLEAIADAYPSLKRECVRQTGEGDAREAV